jgi:hypothetical protein
LLTASLLYLAIAVLRVLFSEDKNEAVKELWDFSK